MELWFFWFRSFGFYNNNNSPVVFLLLIGFLCIKQEHTKCKTARAERWKDFSRMHMTSHGRRIQRNRTAAPRLLLLSPITTGSLVETGVNLGQSDRTDYCLIFDDSHCLFQRKAVRPSTRSIIDQLSPLNMLLLYCALSFPLFSKKITSMCMPTKTFTA